MPRSAMDPLGSAMGEVLVGRQPILDTRGAVVGYELLFRSDDNAGVQPLAGKQATARVVASTLTELGLDRLVGSASAWINVERDFILEGLAETMPAERTVLEVLENQLI